jgi:hypothetical protein
MLQLYTCYPQSNRLCTLGHRRCVLQRNDLQNCIYQYAEELPEVPQAALTEEERLWLELMGMIDEGKFGEDKVIIDMFKAATVQNGRFPIKCRRPRRGEKEDCWVLVAERRMEGTDAGQHDLWLHCATALARVRWTSSHDENPKQLKMILGTGQRLNAVQTDFGSTVFQEGKWEFEEHSGSADVDIIPSMLRADMEGRLVFKPNMVTPLNCAVCPCLEMEVPGEESIYIPCSKLGGHG